MLMVWRSLLRRSCASIIQRILVSSVELGGFITFMVRSEHGKVDQNAEKGYISFELILYDLMLSVYSCRWKGKGSCCIL